MESVYLHDIPLSQAQERWKEVLTSARLWGVLGHESIPLDEHACGRVTAEAIWAKISSPHYHASAMDGFCVRSAHTLEAQPSNPVSLECGLPETSPQAAYLDTGDALPLWADAVIPIENVEMLDETGGILMHGRKPARIRIRAAVTPWSHIRPMGEDIVATQLVLPAGHTLRPVDLGAIAASGNTEIQVAKKPRVAILPTGDELVTIGKPVSSGDIIEFNSLVLAAQVNAWGGQAQRYPITPDQPNILAETLGAAAAQADLVLLNAGSSAGSEDYSVQVIERLGRVLVHGIAVRPGHPVILGMLQVNQRQVPVIGVPGYPVSAALTGEIFVEPLLALWLGRKPHTPIQIEATLTRKITSPAGDDDYVRVAVGKVGDKVLAAPLSRGAGVITSLVRADGLAHLPSGVQGLPAGAQIKVSLYRGLDELDNTILAIGSHDLILDLMAQYLAQHNRRLASANVGSQGGLVALRRGEAHLAGSHLLDPDTGEYNLSAIRQYMPGIATFVIALAGRQQGLLVQPGNPKQIQDLGDLSRPDVVFVNRQRGAGTRVLLDYQLKQRNIAPESIRGYNQEEYTHLAVAAAIASGRVDCGLGIAAAAKALNLDFLPLFQERYDLVIPQANYSSELLAPLLALLHQPEFQRAVVSLPGYDISQMGKVIATIT